MAGRISVDYDAARVERDMAERGWMVPDLARAADLSPNTVRHFLDGKFRTAKTAAKIAHALGYSPRRYLSRTRVSA